MAKHLFQKGHKHSEETKRKMSESHNPKSNLNLTYRIPKGKSPWNKGKEYPQIKGSKNPSWRGGKSFEPYSTDWTDDLRESIRKRDNYICQICGIHQDELNGWSKKLDVHHIDYNKDNLDPKNLISLCRSCHLKTNFNRDYWQNYFNNKL